MATFKCPVCKRIYVIQKYDKDFVCMNSLSQKKKFQNLVKENNFTNNNWNNNEWRTREDAYRDVFVENIKPLHSDKNRYLGGTQSSDW